MKTDKELIDEALSIVGLYEEDKTHPLDNILEIFQFFREPDFVKSEYDSYLSKRKKKGKPITVRGIDWNDIIEIYNQKFEELWSKIGIPENTDDSYSIKEFYMSDVLSMIKEQLFANVYEMANFKIHPSSTTHTPVDAKNIIASQIKKMLEPILRMRELITISLEEDPKSINKLISKSSTLGKIINHSKRFYGKNFDPNEIKVFELIIKDYKKQHDNGYRFSWKTISDKFAEERFNYSSYDDLKKFYNRFLGYKNK